MDSMRVQPSQTRRLILNKRTMIATAASIFAATTFASTAAFAAGVKCGGTNACKGQGFTESGTTLECTQKGGKVL